MDKQWGLVGRMCLARLSIDLTASSMVFVFFVLSNSGMLRAELVLCHEKSGGGTVVPSDGAFARSRGRFRVSARGKRENRVGECTAVGGVGGW